MFLNISNFLYFTVHGISSNQALSIREKIKAKAFKGMPSFSNTTMANVMSNPGTVVLEKLSDEIISKYNCKKPKDHSSLKLAMECYSTNLKVSLLKLSPSKIGATSIKETTESDSDDEVIISKRPPSPQTSEDTMEESLFKYLNDDEEIILKEPKLELSPLSVSLTSKRSRSTSPASSYSSSQSKIENFQDRKRLRKSSVSPIPSNRQVLTTRFESNKNSATDEKNTNSLESDKKVLKNLQNGSSTSKTPTESGRQTRRKIGPASKQKREISQK